MNSIKNKERHNTVFYSNETFKPIVLNLSELAYTVNDIIEIKDRIVLKVNILEVNSLFARNNVKFNSSNKFSPLGKIISMLYCSLLIVGRK